MLIFLLKHVYVKIEHVLNLYKVEHFYICFKSKTCFYMYTKSKISFIFCIYIRTYINFSDIIQVSKQQFHDMSRSSNVMF